MFFVTYKAETMEDINIRYGYCRCSTNENNQDITRQINELMKVRVLEENIVYEFISDTKKEHIIFLFLYILIASLTKSHI